jgi:hypothetical protein
MQTIFENIDWYFAGDVQTQDKKYSGAFMFQG